MSATTAPPLQKQGLVKRLLVGRRIPSNRLEHTLMPKILALPVFSSDALSSVAYATEEIMVVLLAASLTATHLVMPIAIGIAVLLAIVVTSYRQTVRAYPSGGGAYIVSRENLGRLPALVAAAALLIDYVLTVSVSVVAGVVAIISAFPGRLETYRMPMALGFVALVTIANLRGVREAGWLFAVPTYAFILSIFVMVVVGFIRCLGGCPPAEHLEYTGEIAAAGTTVGLFVILHAFSSGSTALTGVEAISNGVTVFRRPQARNAAKTLTIMGAISITLFLGISFLATNIPGIIPNEDRSVVAQIAHTVFGGGLFFYIVQFFTAAILILAANTAYQGFPTLASILARDRFLPRQFMNRGDKLVFSNGVLVLGAFASLLIVAFNANLSRLIQLYVVGVFASFTLSQSGMVRHWIKEKRKGESGDHSWKHAIVINAIGAATTFVVMLVVTYTKFLHGAWIVIVAMPFIVLMFDRIYKHYGSVRTQLRAGIVEVAQQIPRNHVVLLVTGLHAATSEALGYIRSFRPVDVHAVFLADDRTPATLQADWEAFAPGAPPLELLPAGRGRMLEAMREYLQAIPRDGDDFATVVVPELIETRLSIYLLRKNELVRMKAGLLREPNTVVTDVPVVTEGPGGPPIGVDGKALIPQRTVALVFVSGVHDAAVRAVNYARTLQAADTRAIHFALDPEQTGAIIDEWAALGVPVPLEIVEAPFRDLSGPMLKEVRAVTARPDTVAAVIVPEFIVPKWRHMILHNQNALFVKRLMLYEERAILTSVPFTLK